MEAVIDKDLSAALLARALSADRLLMLTDVAAVYADWGGPDARPLGVASPETLRAMDFEKGTMGPEDRGRLPLRRSNGR